jgi:hypothetical protein
MDQAACCADHTSKRKQLAEQRTAFCFLYCVLRILNSETAATGGKKTNFYRPTAQKLAKAGEKVISP